MADTVISSSNVDEIDIISKYRLINKEFNTSDSSHIRTKEILDEMFTEGKIAEEQKTEVLSTVLVGLNNASISGSLSTAVEWAKIERSNYLERLRLEKDIDLLKKDSLIKDEELKSVRSNRHNVEAGTIRNYGTPVISGITDKVSSLSNTGKAYEDILLIKKQVVNAEKEGILADTRIRDINASIYKSIASTYNEHGMFNGYVITENGIDYAPGSTDIDTTPAYKTTQNDLQVVIAKMQANGYAWNAKANAATGLAATIGTGLTSGQDIFTGTTLVSDWGETITDLKDVFTPYETITV